MSKIISGRILSYDEEERIISIHDADRIRFFYFQRSLLNKINKYIAINRFIQFTITDEIRVYRRFKVSTVDYIVKIMQIRYRKNIVYYDIKNIKKGTKALIDNLKYRMFLDLEMSMHPYKVDKSFKQEIIQVGYQLEDENDNIVETYNEIIKPTIHNKLTRRTLKFLELNQNDVDKGIPFKEFYTHFAEVVDKYKPAILVWGRNDFLALREAYKINKLPSLRGKTRYINLLKLHKNVFNLKNDLGLFNALKLYNGEDVPQTHCALEDAQATATIFKGFRDVVDGLSTVDTSQYK